MWIPGRYILKGKDVVECPDLEEWVKGFKIDNRRVALTDVGIVRISTVFLGLDHLFGFDHPFGTEGHPCQSITGSSVPLLFETMVFGGAHNQEMNRYTTWEEAERDHNAMVQKIKNEI